MKQLNFLFSLLLLNTVSVTGQNEDTNIESVVYKTVDTVPLVLDVLYPPRLDKNKQYPAAAFFHGQRLKGERGMFLPQARYLVERGIVCFLVEHVRTKENRLAQNDFDLVTDAKSSIRFIRGNAERFNVNPRMIVSVGFSSGGRTAAATGLISQYNDDHDDLSVSARPDALVLLCPVLDAGPGSGRNFEFRGIGEAYLNFSPVHNIRKGAPPTILFFGAEEPADFITTGKYFKVVMDAVGSRCDLLLYEGQKHGFFGYQKGTKYFEETLQEMIKFLSSIGFPVENIDSPNKARQETP